MVFRILDASAFYAGVPFHSLEEYHTTSLVYDEIRHLGKSHDALEILMQAKRLRVEDPQQDLINQVKNTAKKTGDISELSPADISCIALCLQLKGEMVSDDFAVLNVSKNLGLKTRPIMTSGIKKVGRWIYFCKSCKKSFSEKTTCPICGNKLQKKLLPR